MIKNQGILAEEGDFVPTRGPISPARILVILIGGIFMAEVIAMIVIYFLHPLPYHQQVILDAFIMMVLVFPILYYLSFRPLMQHIDERQRAEQALRASNERFTKAFYSNAAALSITTLADGRYIDVNESFLRAFGYTRAEVIGRTVLELKIYHEPAEERAKLVQILRERGSVSNYELMVRVKSGKLRSMEVSLDQIELDGEACILATLNDITERRQAEISLRQSEEKFRTLADWTYDWEYWVDQQGNIVYISPSSEFITGCRPEEFIADPSLLARVVHPDDRIFFEDHQKSIHAELAGMDNIEFRVVARDGSEHWIDHICRPLFGTDNRYLGRRVSNRDITKRKRAEAALEAERLKLRNIMDTMPDGIYIVNQKHDIEYVNPVIEREFGPVQGRKCYRYFHDRTERCPWCKNDEVFDGKTVHWEWNSEKTSKTYDLFDTPITNLDGSISKLELFHDITHRKLTEAELERRNLELQTLSAIEHKQRQLAETLRASAQALAQTLDLDAVFRTLLKHVRSVVQSDTASVIILEGESLLSVRGVEGYEQWTDPNQILSLRVDGENNPFYRRLILTRRSLLIPDTAEEPDWKIYPGTESIRNYMAVPIKIEEKIIGVVGLGKTEADYFTEEHIQWAEALVGQAAVAIQNAWLFEQLQLSNERLHSLSHRLVEIQESERHYIARELHDEAGQALTSLMVDLRLLERRASQPEAVITTVAEMEATLDGVIENLHRLAMALRPASLDHLGLVAALRQHVESIGEKSGLRVQFSAAELNARLPPNMETVLYRIVQEALTNVVRYAHASRVDVVLKRRNDKLILIIEDDGVGFDPEAFATDGHLGLYGMRERADMIDGKLIVESAPGKGTTIMVEVAYVDPVVDRG